MFFATFALVSRDVLETIHNGGPEEALCALYLGEPN